MAQAFSALLGCAVNDIEADFFALGGHSLLAMRLAAQLSRAFAARYAGADYGRLDGE
ncbi:MAG: phosphopantetheine-binding protein [Enterobacter hormaechei]